MKIQIETSAAGEGEFAAIDFVYRDDGTLKRVPLIIRFKSLYEFSGDTSSLSFDFFLIASMIYGIDNLLDRERYSSDGWSREIDVRFPVRHPATWQPAALVLQETLTFLTGDYWKISFEKIRIRKFYKDKKKKRKSRNSPPAYDKKKYGSVNLFSGGLDSLVGAIDTLERIEPGSRVALVSHFDENSSGPSKDQETLFDYLDKKYPEKIDWIQDRVFLQNKDNKGRELTSKDHNYRSRSFLFIAMAVYVAASTKKVSKILIPENGTISLNYPLTPSRIGSLSTRTTHPYYLSRLHELLKAVGIKIEILNPYQFMTKGELLQNCQNKKVLKGIYEKSVSCGKRARRQYWDNRKGTDQCGVCMPCIYRRAGLHQLGWDNQLYGSDLLACESPETFKKDTTAALFDYLKTDLGKEEIKRGLIVNGSFPADNLDEFAGVVVRAKKELIKWLKDGGNQEIKSAAGIE